MRKEIGVLIAGAALVLEGCSNVSTPSPKQSPEVPTQTPITETASPIPSLALSTESISPLALPVDVVDCQKDPLDGATGSFSVDNGKYVRIGGKTQTGEEDLVDVIVDNQGTATFKPENSGLKGSLSKMDGSAIFQDKHLLINLVPDFSKPKRNFNIAVICADRIPYVFPSPDLPKA